MSLLDFLVMRPKSGDHTDWVVDTIVRWGIGGVPVLIRENRNALRKIFDEIDRHPDLWEEAPNPLGEAGLIDRFEQASRTGHTADLSEEVLNTLLACRLLAELLHETADGRQSDEVRANLARIGEALRLLLEPSK